MLVRLLCLLLSGMLITACGSVSYYSQAVNGHYALLEDEEAIEKILAENKFDEDVRARLKRALAIRQFASDKLGLPDNDSYKTFVKLKQKYPIWNVVAAERFSVNARQWCFLFVGCISYRGYFKEQAAEDMAKELRTEGYDVTVSPAAAYSTLGWFDDPLLSSMLYKEEAHLAGIIFHELAHQQVYIDDDSSFNEAFATAVELEGVRRWLESQGDAGGIERYREYKQRQRDFNNLLKATRQQLIEVYQSDKPEVDKLRLKAETIAAMKTKYKSVKQAWDGYSGYDSWMARDTNNADLALVATYHEMVPMFEQLLKENDYDLPRFYQAVAALGELPRQQRQKGLAVILNNNKT